MAYFAFDVEFVSNEITPTGKPFTSFVLAVRISDSVRGEFLYPMTVQYTDGMVLHDKNKLNSDFSHVQLRRDLISSMKEFVKSQVE